MNIEIHKSEIEQRVREQIQSGQFHDAEELLLKALDALREKEELGPSCALRKGEAESDFSGGPSRTVFEQGLGLFGSPEDAALLDEVV